MNETIGRVRNTIHSGHAYFPSIFIDTFCVVALIKCRRQRNKRKKKKDQRWVFCARTNEHRTNDQSIDRWWWCQNVSNGPLFVSLSLWLEFLLFFLLSTLGFVLYSVFGAICYNTVTNTSFIHNSSSTHRTRLKTAISLMMMIVRTPGSFILSCMFAAHTHKKPTHVHVQVIQQEIDAMLWKNCWAGCLLLLTFFFFI